MYIKTIILILLILLIITFLYDYKENNSGALVQLYAKGSQDIYLTGSDSLYPYYYSYYPRYYYPRYYYPRYYYPRYYYPRYYPSRLRRYFY
jgi:hypothetical protein